MAIFNPRYWETEGEQLGEAYMLIVVTVHEVGWQLVAGYPKLSSHQESLQGPT